MYRILILCLLLLNKLVCAEETVIVISENQYFNSKVAKSTPQIFLFDTQGVIVHHKIGTDQGLKRAFTKTKPIQDESVTKKKIIPLLGETLKFKDYDFTLVFVTDSNEKDYCPPCLKQNKINKKVIGSLKDKNIHLMTLPIEFSKNRTVTIL
jgi:thioredoxin-related protein